MNQIKPGTTIDLRKCGNSPLTLLSGLRNSLNAVSVPEPEIQDILKEAGSQGTVEHIISIIHQYIETIITDNEVYTSTKQVSQRLYIVDDMS